MTRRHSKNELGFFAGRCRAFRCFCLFFVLSILSRAAETPNTEKKPDAGTATNLHSALRRIPNSQDTDRRLRQIYLLDQRADSRRYPPPPERMIASLVPKQTAEGFPPGVRLQRIRVADALKINNDLFREGEREEAFRHLNLLLQDISEPELRKQLLTSMGVMRFKQRRYAEAAQCFDEAHQLYPGDIRLVCNLAASYMNDGKLEPAEKLLLGIPISLIDDSAQAAAVQFNLACIYSMLNRKNEAIEYLGGAARSDPVFTGTHLGDTQLDNIRSDNLFSNIAQQIDLQINPGRNSAANAP